MTSASPLPAKVPAQMRSRGSFFRLHALDFAYAKEMLLPMSLGLIVLMLVLAGNFVYWAINSVVNQGMSVAPIIKLFFLSMPGFAVQGVPAGVILGVCLVLNRTVRDNEILALRGGGASLPRIVMPFLFMSLCAACFNYWIVEKVAPITNDRAQKLLAKIVSQNAAPLIETDRYFRAGPYYFYVGTAQGGILNQVMIYERASSKYSAFAPSVYPVVRMAQKAYENPQKKGEWILENGVMHTFNSDGTLQSEARFGSAKIAIEAEISNYFGEQKQPFAMTGDELSARINDLKNAAFDAGSVNSLEVDYWRRFSFPGACLVLALCAAPLAVRYARHGSFAGLVAAFLLAFLWQGFDGWFRALGIAGYLSPLVAAWGTNALFLIIGGALLVRER